MVSLPGNLFYGVTIPCCLWFLTRNKKPEGLRDRSGEVLFIDARKLGTIYDRVRRDFSYDDVLQISDAYHAWRGQSDAIERRGAYKDISGFCHSASLDDIKTNNYVLTPGRFVGAENEIDDGIPFEEKFSELKNKLAEQFNESERLQNLIRIKVNEL